MLYLGHLVFWEAFCWEAQFQVVFAILEALLESNRQGSSAKFTEREKYLELTEQCFLGISYGLEADNEPLLFLTCVFLRCRPLVVSCSKGC